MITPRKAVILAMARGDFIRSWIDERLDDYSIHVQYRSDGKVIDYISRSFQTKQTAEEVYETMENEARAMIKKAAASN
jgi:adenylosuccinate synthase